jgi:thymidine kinase
MFSGKSEELLRRIRRAEIAQLSPLLFKPSLDDRYGESDVVSHAGSRLRCISIGASAEIEAHPALPSAIVVGIDEVQFLDDGIVEVALRLVQRGARVLAAGLDRDFRGEPFGPMPQLLAHADDADKLHAICQICAGPATMTQRLVDGQPAPFAGEPIQVGALDSYEARCRSCFQPGEDALGAAVASAHGRRA